MSGGSFNYLFLANSICERPYDLGEAIATIEDEAPECTEILERLRAIQRLMEQADKLFDQECRDVVHDLEWWKSGDIIKEDFVETAMTLKHKDIPP